MIPHVPYETPKEYKGVKLSSAITFFFFSHRGCYMPYHVRELFPFFSMVPLSISQRLVVGRNSRKDNIHCIFPLHPQACKTGL